MARVAQEETYLIPVSSMAEAIIQVDTLRASEIQYCWMNGSLSATGEGEVPPVKRGRASGKVERIATSALVARGIGTHDHEAG